MTGIRAGLVSVTFRKLSPQQIVELVARAGLDGLEWGGDIHVPHGDLERAREVRKMTLDAGLNVASYGSYYRVAAQEKFTFEQVLSTAVELGAPVIRVWAGDQASAKADATYRTAVADASRQLGEQAAAAGLAVAYEFHTGTLTDTTESAVNLVKAVNHPNVFTYWQMPNGLGENELDQSLLSVMPYLSNIHVHGSNDSARRPLAAGKDRWRRLFRLLRPAAGGRHRYAMIEFVKDDLPAQFLEDAVVLRELVHERV